MLVRISSREKDLTCASLAIVRECERVLAQTKKGLEKNQNELARTKEGLESAWRDFKTTWYTRLN